MKSNQPKQIILAGLTLAFGFAAVFFISAFLEKKRSALPPGFEDDDIALQGTYLKGYALGFEGLIADWYWMNSLQYVGDKVLKNNGNLDLDNLKPLNLRLLYPYLDNATTLDPQFMSVYEYGTTVLPAVDKDQAIKLTEKGIANNPDRWQLYHYLGFIYWRLGNYEKAAEVYSAGAEIKDAPNWMRLMVGKMKNESGSRETARAIYQQMYEEVQDTQSKETAALRLLELDSLDEREAIKKSLQDFQAKHNRCANNWRELSGELQMIKTRSLNFDKNASPVDPTGIPYLLIKENNQCSVGIDGENSKIPLQ